MLYSDKVMDHFTHPRNVGEIPDADGVGEVGNPKCGDIMKIYLKIDDGIVTDAKFNTFGCGAAIATSSMATELIKGKPVSEAMKLSNKAVVEALNRLGDEFGIAYLFVSHDLSVMRAVTDRLLVLQNGRIVEQGPTAELLASPNHPHTRELVEASPDLDRVIAQLAGG